MFLYFLLVSLGSCIIVSPVNTSCIWGSDYSLASMNETISGRQYELPVFLLKPFSYVEIWFDFREISLNESLFPVELNIGGSVEKLTNYTAMASKFSLYVTRQYNLTITIDLNDNYEMYRYLLINTTTINVSEAQPRYESRFSSFLWVVKQEDNINLPFNFPNIKNFEGFFFNRITDNHETELTMQLPVKGVNYYSENIEYWNTYSTFTVPYIPYISNCENVGGNIFLTKQLEDPTHCDIIPINQTQPINQFLFGSSAKGDSCTHEITCIYDQSLTSRHEYPYWQTLAADGVLMYITNQEIDYSDYEINKQFEESELVPCQIKESGGDNTTDKYPTQIILTLGYYQVSQTEKRMISCDVQFELFTTATENFTYTVKIVQKPLNHTAILIAFGFNFYVYMIAFMIIGAASTIQNFILGMYHWIANKTDRKFIKFRVYLPLLWEVLKGCFLAIIPMLMLASLISIVMGGHLFNLKLNHFSSDSPSDPVVIWDLMNTVEISDYSSALAVNNRSGRLGISFVAVGIYIILTTTKYLIGMERKKERYEEQEVYGQKIDPQLWAKNKFLFGTVIYFVLQLLLMYFAFSNYYGDNIWMFIVLTKVFSMILEEVIDIIFENIISSLPLKIILNITSYLNTLAANNFYEFMFSFLIDVAIEMCEKAYLATIQNITANYLDQKLKQLTIYIDKFLHDGQKEETSSKNQLISQQSQDHQIVVAAGPNDISFEQEMEYQLRGLNSVDDYHYDEVEEVYKQLLFEVNQKKYRPNVEVAERNEDSQDDEEEEKRNDMLEMVVDVFSVPTNIILQPFAVVILWMTYNETGTLNNFGMSWEITPTYIFSNFTLSPFTILNVILALFLLENFHHFEMQQWTLDNLQRYYNRKNYWKSDDDQVPTNCETKVRSVIKACISSQTLFVVIIYVAAMQFVLTGVSAMIANNYDPFSDFGSLLVIASWLIATHLISNITVLIATRVFNIWDYRKFHSASISVEKENPNQISEVKLIEMERGENEENRSACQTGLNLNEMVFKGEEEEEMMSVQQKEVMQEKQQLEQNSINYKSETALKEKKSSEKARQIHLAKAKIASICSKFKPVFQNESKRMEYSLKNKNYLLQNIDRVFNQVKLEELPEDIGNSDMGNRQQKRIMNLRVNLTDISKGESIIKRWLEETKSAKQKAKASAIDIEKTIKRCLYCFNNWGIYFGYKGAMCLECTESTDNLKME